MVKIFVVHSSNCVLKNSVPNCDFIKKVNLQFVPGKHMHNSLAENRFLHHLATHTEMIDHEFVGVMSGRYSQKYPKKCRLRHLNLLKYARDEVKAPCTVDDWYSHSERSHPGMGKLIDELCERNGFAKTGTSFYSNNFICHREVMKGFLAWWIENFEYFHRKYDDKFDFGSNYSLYNKELHPSYFYERLTVAYFANQNLKIVEIPSGESHTKLL